MSEPVLIKLTSGEEVLCIISSETENHIDIEHPLTIHYDRVADSVSFRPLVLWSKDTLFTISRTQIVLISNTLDSLSNKYLEIIAKFEEVIEDTTGLEKSLDLLESYLDNKAEYEYDEFELDNTLPTEETIH